MTGNELTQTYRELDRDCAAFARKLTGGKEPLFIPDEAGMKTMHREWEKLRKRTDALEEPDAVFSLVKHHFEDFLDSQGFELEEAGKHPEKPYLNSFFQIESISRLSRKPQEEQCREVLRCLEEPGREKDTFLRLIQKRHSGKEQYETARALEGTRKDLEKLGERRDRYFPGFDETQRQKVAEKLKWFCGILSEMAEELVLGNTGKEPEQETENLNYTVRMEEEEYRTLLKKRLGVSLDELLAWHREETDKTRAEVFSLAASLVKTQNLPEEVPSTMQEVNELLYKYEGPCDSPEEMFARAEGYLKRTRALAHEYVRLPEDESCRCVEVPESCRDSYPWGGYEGGDFSVRPLEGQMFLNQYNYKNVTDGWIRMNAMHEAYPGHHVQYVRAELDETPETVKIGAKLVPLLEGTCLRTERAFEFLYEEDPFYPLFIAYRRHHASVRITVDLMLFYYGNTVEEAVKKYEEELGFEWGTARKQVQAHLNSPGYFTCYYYGMKKICQWEEEYGFSKKDFTELLFSAGYLSIDRFGELVRLTPEERERYFHEFSGLKEEKEHENI